MEPSDKASTPGTRKNDVSTPTPTPDVKRLSWFTPCKRLGLKRKSPFISTTSSASLSSSTPSTPNSSFKSHRLSFETPVKKNESSGANTTEGKVGLGVSVTTRVGLGLISPCLVQNEALPTLRDCQIETNHDSIKIAIPLPRNEVTPTRHMPVKPAVRLQNERPRPTSHVIEPETTNLEEPITKTETTYLEEPTEENVEILRKRVKEKEEHVAALRLAQLYKKKHDTGKLSGLTKKWRKGCQDALLQLHEKTKSLGYEHTMSELLVQLGIPHDLVQYDPDLEDFKE